MIDCLLTNTYSASETRRHIDWLSRVLSVVRSTAIPRIVAAITLALPVSTLILVRSYSSSEGYLSPDSTDYLSLAENLIRGNGFYTLNSGRAPAGLEYFASWPVGYPTAIFLVANIFHTSVFLASKILNCSLYIASTTLVALYFGSVYPLILSSAECIDIFTHTWSEAPFIFFMIVLCITFATVVESSNRVCYPALVALAPLILILFLDRYIGLFALVLPIISAVIFRNSSGAACERCCCDCNSTSWGVCARLSHP
jgi:hypothetical protein